jgi:hypothetical protein
MALGAPRSPAVATGTSAFTVPFDGEPLAAPPLVLVQPRTQAGGDSAWMDAFAAEVQSTSADSFSVSVSRLDKLDNAGWGQELQLDYIAWLPAADAPPPAGRHRAGQARAGRSDGEPLKQVTVAFDPPFALPPASAAGAIRLLVGPQNDPKHPEFMDVHLVAVEAVWAGGFNASISRADRLGEGWGSTLWLSYVAWLDDAPLAKRGGG